MIDSQTMTVIDELETFQAAQPDAWNIPRDEGKILHTVALLAGATEIVEVGTSYGFSGMFLASAAKATGGRLHTFDIDPRKHQHAGANFERAGLGDVVTLYTGDACERLSELPDGVDFAFLDARKAETEAYWGVLEPKFADRLVVAVDNTATHPAQLGEFVDMLRARDDFTTCPVPCEHGLELAVRP